MGRLFIFLTYGTLFFFDVFGKVNSIFVYLFALEIELILLLLQFIIFNNTMAKKYKIGSQNVLIGAIPFLLFNYFIIYYATLNFDNINSE